MSEKRGRGRPRKTHCLHGHDLNDPEIIWIKPSDGSRQCRKCKRLYKLGISLRKHQTSARAIEKEILVLRGAQEGVS